jgi:hypothetical protein
MTSWGRTLTFALVAALVVVAAAAYAVRERERYQDQTHAVPDVASTEAAAIGTGPRIVFRHTGLDSEYGMVAFVSLADPGGPRAFTDVACDRVDAVAGEASCLVAKRGVVTKFENQLLGDQWQVRSTTSLAGIPSRTRLSPDGQLVATTVFVHGHSYMQSGFSTATMVRAVDGSVDYGNLEKFALIVAGEQVTPRDRNVWGVTFLDDQTFYATVGTGSTTYLVAGDLQARTLTAVDENAECPSLSQDGTHVAFKVDRDPGAGKRWGLAILDLATGSRTSLDRGPKSVDDQVVWLDQDTLLYGQPRRNEPGVTDVWSIDTYPDATGHLLIREAWSPAVLSTASATEGAS